MLRGGVVDGPEQDRAPPTPVDAQIEEQIKLGRLALKDNSLLDDAALRKRAVRALLCYHPFWLSLGLETVLNRRMFHDPSGSQRGVTGDHDLEAVLREEFLSDSTLLVRC